MGTDFYHKKGRGINCFMRARCKIEKWWWWYDAIRYADARSELLLSRTAARSFVLVFWSIRCNR
jgi:hypothetical protein